MIFYKFTKSFQMGVAVVLFSIFAMSPVFVNAAEAPLTEGDKGTGITYECGTKGKDGSIIYGDCNYEDLIAAVQKVVEFMIVLSLAFSVVVIAYAGFLYITSGDISTNRSKANKMLIKVAKGIALMLGAWLIVTFIAKALLTEEVLKVLPLIEK